MPAGRQQRRPRPVVPDQQQLAARRRRPRIQRHAVQRRLRGTSGSGSTGSGGGGGGTTFFDGPDGMVCSKHGCVSLHKPDPIGESLLGLLRNAAYSTELIYTPFNLDCWGDNQESGGCDLGDQCDAWAAEQGMDTQSDNYLVPGALAAMFGVGRAGRPKYDAKNPPPGGWKLSHQNPLIKDKQLRETYEDVSTGAARQRRNPDGSLDFYRADGLSPRQRGKWRDSKVYTVPGKGNHRILVRPDGKIGYAFGTTTTPPRLFPAPWYKDGGEYPGGLK